MDVNYFENIDVIQVLHQINKTYVYDIRPLFEK